MEIMRNPTDGVCDEGYLELGGDLIPRPTVVNFLKIIGSKLITYKNAYHLRYWELLSERQIKYDEDIFLTRDTANLEMPRKEVI